MDCDWRNGNNLDDCEDGNDDDVSVTRPLHLYEAHMILQVSLLGLCEADERCFHR
jgi:hypothetical protein